MHQSSSSSKMSPLLIMQAIIVLLVAAAVVAGIIAQSPNSEMAATLAPSVNTLPTNQPRLVFALSPGQLSDTASIGLLDSQGISSTLTLPVPLAAGYYIERDRFIAFAASPTVSGVFTATYMVQTLDGGSPYVFSTSTPNDNLPVGENYSYSSALLSPDHQSIAYLLLHRSTVDNGLRIQLAWTLYRVKLADSSQSTISSGTLTGDRAPLIHILFWTADDQIYLGFQQDNSTSFSSYPASGGAGKQVATIDGFLPAVSPDGRNIAWLDRAPDASLPDNAEVNRLNILDTSNGSQRSIEAAPGNYLEPTIQWAPEGGSIAYIEHIANATPTANGASSSNIFYEIAVMRLNLTSGNSAATLANFRSTDVKFGSAFGTKGLNAPQLYWCGANIYLPLTRYEGTIAHSTLYTIASDGRSGFRVLLDDWPYSIIGCVH